jgi:dTDP-4-dehydrorhamnose reductase
MTGSRRPTRCLIVGASGQVGAQFLSVLGRDGAIATSRVADRPDWVPLDLVALAGQSGQAEKLLADLRPSAVYCLGGMTDVELCESEAEMAMAANCHGPAALAGAAARHDLPFVYFSTEYVFDGKSGPYTEESIPGPINAYGRSKWMGEQAVLKIHPSPLIVRTTVVYGSDPRGRNFLYGLRRALEAGQSVRVANDQVSTPTYNRDLASVTIALVQEGAAGTFHVCGPERLTRFEFALRAARAMSLDASRIVGVPTAELGQAAPRPLDAGLSTCKLRRFPRLPRLRGLEEAVREWMAESGLEVGA